MSAEDLLAWRPQEELKDLPKDGPPSPSDDEAGSDGERKHWKLLEAISSLGGKGRWKLAERSEAGMHASEFSVGSAGKLALADLLQAAEPASSLATVKRQLKRVQVKTLALPASKEEVARVQREAAFHQSSQALSKWEPIVLKARQAEQLVFPLQKEPAASAPLEHMLRGWTAKTPLEREVFHTLHQHRQPVRDPLLTPVERAARQAMSLEEARTRRAALQRARALQSYYEAKARQAKKIKSKKHRRVVKKGKAQKALGERGPLPEGSAPSALEELDRRETARVMERMGLKHQSRGKRARALAIRTRYEPKARQARQDQLARNKELMQKHQAPDSEEEEEGGLLAPDVDQAQTDPTGSNPWMLRRPTSESREARIPKGPDLLPEPAALEDSASEQESPGADKDTWGKESEERQPLQERWEPSQDAEPVGPQARRDTSHQEVVSEVRALSQKLSKRGRPSRKKPEASSLGAVLPTQSSESMQTKVELGRENYPPDMELPRPVSGGPRAERIPEDQQPGVPRKQRKEPIIDIQNLLTASPPPGTPWAPEELEGDGERGQRQVIMEAFAGDDVIQDFLKEKRAVVEESQPKAVDLTLPGWGEWGGVGLQPRAKKRCRFLVPSPAGPPRKDGNRPNVIISETRNSSMAAHQVHVLPPPFSHPQQFERTIQVPVGATWNTPRAFQKLTTPKVVTKPGHIIKPIRAEDAGCRSSSRSDLSVVQRAPNWLSTQHRRNTDRAALRP
ncbi:U3 small nucleolar RNA-associated protein 14 homolog A-like [Echinops telfairi]|uniref:U3 small nucleolar RNA-associated protein 14 homolog A-like n=1 Tax=Echinops telfairi TaxID=9371 RepID=A0ABM0J345_ECHTE|nr:U3 small nucleolar RNA-associated protein 14 homolog A-like [Echinops telfairi]